MPRHARIVPAGLPLHVVHRGHNRRACFLSPDDYQRYLNSLEKFADGFACHVHAYVLMTNHVHLLVTAQNPGGIAALMKEVAQRHAQFMNWKTGQTGSFWEGRFHSNPVESDHYLFACYRYIELNPVRAGLVSHPADYPWSSYRCNARAEPAAWIQPHSGYLALGEDPRSRAIAYRDLFNAELDPRLVEEIRAVSREGNALGTPEFRARLEAQFGLQASPRRRGRPRSVSASTEN